MHDGRVEVSTTIHAPASRTWSFLVDPNKIPLVLPGLVENSNIPPLPLKNGSSFHYKYQMYGVMLEGTWRVTGIDPEKNYEAVTDGDVASHWNYKLSTDTGGTRVDLVVTYETPRTLMGRIKGDVLVRINQQEAEHYFQNLKTVLEMQD